MNLAGDQIKDTYGALLNIGASGALSTLQPVTDGFGNVLPFEVSTTTFNFTGTVTGGPIGPTGAAGTSGTSGTSGVSGSSGTSGTDGTSGTSGIDGTSGTSGISGSSGTSGTSGVSGSSGTSGTDGTSGTSGINGATGPAGPTGAAAPGGGSPITVEQTNSLVSTAIGGTAYTGANCAIAIGNNATAKVANSIAIGPGADAYCGIAIGNGCAESGKAINIGFDNTRSYNDEVTVGNNNNVPDGSNLYVLGSNNGGAGSPQFITIIGGANLTDGFGAYKNMFGFNNIVASTCSQTIGFSNNICCNASLSSTLGYGNTIFPGATGAIVLGNSSVGGTGACSSIVIGNGDSAAIIDSVIIGKNINAPANICVGSEDRNNYNILIGKDICLANNSALGNCCNVIIGSLTQTPGYEQVSIGWGNRLGVNYNDIAIGKNTCAVAGHSTAMGTNASASGFISISMGLNSSASQTSSIAIGGSSTSSHTCAVALGAGISTEKEATTHVQSLIAYGQAASKAHSVGTTGGTVTLNWDNSNAQFVTLDSSISSLTKSNPIDGGVYTVFVTQGGTGSYTVAWGSDVKWAGGTGPVLSTAVGATDAVTLIYYAGITGYYGNANLNFA